VNLVSVEQLLFMEFSQCLPSPSCLVSLGMKPYEGNAVLEINPGLVFPTIEMLLGGGSRSLLKVARETTMRVEDLMDLKEDDVLTFDYPVERPVDLSVNGKVKFRGGIVSAGRKRAFEIEEAVEAG
jgi:flagellar motor switch protein FliM